MVYDTCEALVNQHIETRDFQALQLDLIRVLSIECPVTEQQFMNEKAEVSTEKSSTKHSDTTSIKHKC